MADESPAPNENSGAGRSDAAEDSKAVRDGNSPPRVRRSWWTLVGFRLFAIGLGLSPFVLLEIGLRASGWRPLPAAEDPYVGFQDIRTLFERQGDRYVIPKFRQEYFYEDSFPIEKADKEFRIFCLGGSTVQGRPYSIQTSFTSWLQIYLGAAEPDRRWEVVNCGGVSYASYRLTPIMKECLSYQPDLFVLYTGHNEFLEARTYPVQKERSRFLAKTHAAVMQMRVCQLAQRAFSEPPPVVTKTTLPAEVDALLDYRGGLEQYHRDENWRRGVVSQYELNLRLMIEIAKEAGVPVLLVNPVSNLRDCPPFKIEIAHDLGAPQRQRINQLWSQARRVDKQRPEEAIQLLKQALQIDEEHAGLWYHLARCYETQEDWRQAREAFLRSKDADVCPLRMLESMHDAVQRVARETRTPLVDARRFYDETAKNGIPGDDLLVDHVHPSIKGHQQIANLLLEELVARRFLQQRDGWQARRKAAVNEQLSGLGEEYFAHGKQRLDGLRRWSQGRSFRVRGID